MLDSIDESLMYVTANRVGIFRRGKSKCKVVSGGVLLCSCSCQGRSPLPLLVTGSVGVLHGLSSCMSKQVPVFWETPAAAADLLAWSVLKCAVNVDVDAAAG